jgi:hypothetical protein
MARLRIAADDSSGLARGQALTGHDWADQEQPFSRCADRGLLLMSAHLPGLPLIRIRTIPPPRIDPRLDRLPIKCDRKSV